MGKKNICLLAGVLAFGLAGCVTPNLGKPLANAPEREQVAVAPAGKSQSLSAYYARIQRGQLARGLMRVDGGGPDTRFTAEDLARNFERIALRNEYQRGAGLQTADAAATPVSKWSAPIKMTVSLSPVMPLDQQDQASAQVAQYAARLQRITRHDIAMSDEEANYHVLFVAEADMPQMPARINKLVPGTDPKTLRLFERLPRGIHCLVMAFPKRAGSHEYGTVIAVIRAEHPPLLRRSCIHEELAQGLGLGNDYPLARPSIFNDDDEFALLTRHDELLLQILYNPRLTPGMPANQAMPIVREIAAELIPREAGG